MQTWLTQMPEGMCLKSEGFASTLYDPEGAFTLGHYCRERNLPYADVGVPIPLETFAAYGLEFQKRFVPALENEQVVSIDRSGSHFQIGLESGGTALARRVVIAVGISHYQYVPPELDALPEDYLSHSSRYHTYGQFRNRHVTVIGGGSSAGDVAAALLEAGAEVDAVARKAKIHFHNPPEQLPRPLKDRILSPTSGLGRGWRSLFCVEAPLVFRMLPENFRLKVVRKHLGPSVGWVARDKVVGRVAFHLSLKVEGAEIRDGRVHLHLRGADGSQKAMITDHVIAATGYRVDLRRLAFLNAETLAAIRSVEHTPILSSNFESSIPGLYFVGAASANTFGPLARFACGAKFASRRLSEWLARSAVRGLVGAASKSLTLAG
jgi:Pyridine nucleotide-disulphide oxidoreductase